MKISNSLAEFIAIAHAEAIQKGIAKQQQLSAKIIKEHKTAPAVARKNGINVYARF